MRILFASYFHLPATAGVWAYVRELKQALERAGHEVDILTHHPEKLRYDLTNTGDYIQKRKVKDPVERRLGPLFDRYFPGLDQLVKEYEYERTSFELAAACFDLWRYDLIHTQDVVSTRALSRVKPKTAPLIATLHGSFAHELLQHGEIKNQTCFRWHYCLSREYFGAAAADAVLVPTEDLKMTLVKDCKVPDVQIEVVPGGYGANASTGGTEDGTNAMIERVFAIYEQVLQRKLIAGLRSNSNRAGAALISEQSMEKGSPFDWQDYEQMWKRILPHLPRGYTLLDPDFVRLLQTSQSFSS